jgi:arsenate reductase-like glutaredoxin family protein
MMSVGASGFPRSHSEDMTSPSGIGQRSRAVGGRSTRLNNFAKMVVRCGPGSHHAGLGVFVAGTASRATALLNSRIRPGLSSIPSNLTEKRQMEVQVFGINNHAEVRKALRFFAERRIRTHFVDFKVRGPAPGELKRFADRFGAEALVDRTSKRFVALGLGPARYGDGKWLQMLVDEPLLLKLPLVRSGTNLTVGLNEAAWTSWIAATT